MLSNTGLRQHVAQHTMGADMLALNRLLQVWALALERWHLSKTNTPQSKWHLYTDRGHIKKPKVNPH